MKLLLTSFSLFLFYLGFTQCLPNTITGYGSINFKDSLLAVDSFKEVNDIIKHKVFYTKNPVSSALLDVAYKKRVTQITSTKKFVDDECNTADGCFTDGSQCYYTVYYPSGINFSTCRLPAIILFHGGGFSDCKSDNDGGRGNINFVAKEFVKRGYVAFMVEYRTGRYIVPGFAYLSAQQSLAEYRAFQDARGAVRTIILHQRRHNTNWTDEPFQIDTNKIFIGGNSAGSIIAIQTAYYAASQIADIFPTPINQPTVKDILGSIDADYYYGDSTIDITTRIRGVMDMWGQAAFPLSKRNDLPSFWAANAKIPPLIGFHGKKDKTLPIDTTLIYFSPTNLSNIPINYSYYNSESRCLKNGLMYKLDGVANTPDVFAAGSLGIYNVLRSLGIKTEVYVDCDMGHGVDTTTDADGYLTNNFGLFHQTDIDSVYIYLVQRATTFFQAILTNRESYLTGTSLFIECVNERVKSNPLTQFSDNIGSCLSGNTPCPNAPDNFDNPDEE